MNEINIIPIGSGSTGNTIYIEIGDHKLLIDMGISCRRIMSVLDSHQRSLEEVDAIFLTHSHHDHIKSAAAIARKTSCKVYGNPTVMYPIREIDAERVIIDNYNTQQLLDGLDVTMFHVTHDYMETCGFTFASQGRKIGYVTDCGRMNEMIIDTLSGSDVIIIESNHDINMLKNGPYPRQLQKRILSEYGHLSNDECADTISRLYEHGTRNFLLAHISLINNTPDIALNTVKEKMTGKDIFLYACPDEGDDLLSF